MVVECNDQRLDFCKPEALSDLYRGYETVVKGFLSAGSFADTKLGSCCKCLIENMNRCTSLLINAQWINVFHLRSRTCVRRQGPMISR